MFVQISTSKLHMSSGTGKRECKLWPKTATSTCHHNSQAGLWSICKSYPSPAKFKMKREKLCPSASLERVTRPCLPWLPSPPGVQSSNQVEVCCYHIHSTPAKTRLPAEASFAIRTQLKLRMDLYLYKHRNEKEILSLGQNFGLDSILLTAPPLP